MIYYTICYGDQILTDKSVDFEDFPCAMRLFKTKAEAKEFQKELKIPIDLTEVIEVVCENTIH